MHSIIFQYVYDDLKLMKQRTPTACHSPDFYLGIIRILRRYRRKPGHLLHLALLWSGCDSRFTKEQSSGGLADLHALLGTPSLHERLASGGQLRGKKASGVGNHCAGLSVESTERRPRMDFGERWRKPVSS